MANLNGWPFGQVNPEVASTEANYIAGANFGKYSDSFEVQRELKRYLLIRKILNRPVTMESKLVDEAWHLFILDTRNYFTFCECVFGHYLHHVSSKFEPDENFKIIYQELFGETPHPMWEPNYVDPLTLEQWRRFSSDNCA